MKKENKELILPSVLVAVLVMGIFTFFIVVDYGKTSATRCTDMVSVLQDDCGLNEDYIEFGEPGSLDEIMSTRSYKGCDFQLI